MKYFVGIKSDGWIEDDCFFVKGCNTVQEINDLYEDGYKPVIYDTDTCRVSCIDKKSFLNYAGSLDSDFFDIKIGNRRTEFGSKAFYQYDSFLLRVFDSLYYINQEYMPDLAFRTKGSKLIASIKSRSRGDVCSITIDLKAREFNVNYKIPDFPKLYTELNEVDISSFDEEFIDFLVNSDDSFKDMVKNYLGNTRYYKLMLLGGTNA